MRTGTIEYEYNGSLTCCDDNGQTWPLFDGMRFGSPAEAQEALSKAYADPEWELDLDSDPNSYFLATINLLN